MSDCIYTRVTATIIEALERGVRPWAPSWDTPGGLGVLPIRATGEAYRGVNVLLLWGSAAAQGFDQPRWMTFKQAQAAGGCVRKGEKGTKVVYAGRIVREGEADAKKGAMVEYVAQKAEALGWTPQLLRDLLVEPEAPKPDKPARKGRKAKAQVEADADADASETAEA